MINNDVLRSIRYMLDLSEPKVAEIACLADSSFVIERDDVEETRVRVDFPDW
jgi:uncharacterized protein YehS (DUF1456 family)